MIEINNLTSFNIDKKRFSTVAKKVLKGENREREKISLAFVSKKEMQKLNKKFRGKNKPTDVLSFSNVPSESLGEIVICPEIVKENASVFAPPTPKATDGHSKATADKKKYKELVRREMMKVFVHGILHLLGYDHEKNEKDAEKMERKQEKYLSNLI